MDLSTYTETDKTILRDAYVGNETDTDQYRETQPQAGMSVAADLFRLLTEAAETETVEAFREATACETFRRAAGLVAAWTEAIGEDGAACAGYEGAEEASAFYALYFDVLWARGEHPYWTEIAELNEDLENAR